ncbi:MAG: hypothetical protein AABZ06_02395 [Bdellovibrionota bacterium]
MPDTKIKSTPSRLCPMCKEGSTFIMSLASTVSKMVGGPENTGGKTGSLNFHPSPDFRSLTCRHGQFQFSKSQAAVIKVMYEHLLNGSVELHTSEILNFAGLDPSEDNLGKIFRQRKSRHPAWNVLIKSVSGKRGYYTLNI